MAGDNVSVDDVVEQDVIETGRPADYPLWHGPVPMEMFLTHRLRSERFVVAGEGIRVRDAAGRWYIDGRSACWNLGLGYSATDVKAAIREQLDTLPSANLLAYDRPADITVRYARALRDAVGPALPYLRLGNTGSQMTETAVMLSRFARGLEGTPNRTALLSFEHSYHGLGPGANAFSGMVAAFDFCGPLMPDVHFLPAGGDWAASVRAKVAELTPERVTAVIIEPQMQAPGIVASAQALRDLAAACRETGVHLIADEVTTGFGRTGAMSRCLEVGVEPDMLVLGKNMTSGYVPIGALMLSAQLYEMAAKPSLPRFLPAGSATDGHPVAAAAGLAVLRVYERDGILAHVREVGAALHDRLAAVATRRLGLSQVAGSGLMQILPLCEADGTPWPGDRREAFRMGCEERGLLLSLGGTGVWVVPPLITTAGEADEIVDIIDATLESLTSAPAAA